MSCSVKTCKSLRRLNVEGVRFHRFPTGHPLSNWKKALNLDEKWTWSPQKYVCSKHFKPEDYMAIGDTARLRLQAVPSVFLNEPVLMVKDEPDLTPNSSLISSTSSRSSIRKRQREQLAPSSENNASSSPDTSPDRSRVLRLVEHFHNYSTSPTELKKKYTALQQVQVKTRQQVYSAKQKIKTLSKKVVRLNAVIKDLKTQIVAAPVDDGPASPNLLIERVEHLLQSEMWTDCQFKVGVEPYEQTFKGHKVIISLASPVFAAMFFGSLLQKGPIVISDVEPDAFKCLLQYMYTEKVVLTSIEQAFKICYAARKYMLPELVNECKTYILSSLCPANVCKAYELAKLFNEKVIKNKCMYKIREKLKQVLNESSFNDVNLSTILTIYEQEMINIDSELDLFLAIERYAAKLNIKGNASSESETSKNNYSMIRKILMKIRFLSLSSQQFADGPAKSNLLTKSEKYAIGMNICSTESDTPMPEGFNTSRIGRRYYILM